MVGLYSSLGSRSVLVVRLAGWVADKMLFTKEFLKSCNLASNVYFQCLKTFLRLIIVYQ